METGYKWCFADLGFAMKRSVSKTADFTLAGYDTILSGLVDLLESARRISARSVNAVMTASYWEVGRRIVEFEQGGKSVRNMGRRFWSDCQPISPGNSGAASRSRIFTNTGSSF